jgi:polar amino acid transport system substrate-binding protein
MIATSKKLAGDFRDLEDFNNSKVIIACRRGSTACDKVRRYTQKAKWIFFDDEQLALQEVLNGNAHGVPSSWPQVTLWTHLNQDVLHSPITSPIQPNPAAIAIRKGDFDFKTYIDNWVEWNEDFLAERRQYWFGTLDWLKEHDIDLKK